MCGIVASVHLGGGPADLDLVRRMTETLAHRGPDGQGVQAFRWAAGAGGGAPSVGLGHRRLAILDLTDRASQPMVRGAVAVTYNGEIYNYLELREELKGLGHTFTTESDTEVLLEAYREWGLDFLGRLNGIFAFVLFDGERGRCLAVRDRLGVKPLFWAKVGEVLHIASEIRALQLAMPGAELEEALAYDFLLNGRLDHSEQTFFRGVSRLPAGHYLEVEKGRVEARRYWEARATDARHGRSFEENAEEFGALLRDSVRLQMRSDVPVGCCLSGGLDSSSVVSLAASLTETPISVFTARYRNPEIDEWGWASAVHAEKRVRPVAVFAEPEAYWEHLDEVVASQEEPFGGPSVYAQWRLMKEIRANGIKVVLDGQGGDELLCGYAKYFYFRLADLVRSGKWFSALGAGAMLVLGGGRQHFNFRGARRYLPGGWWFKKRSASLLRPEFAERWRDRSVGHPRGSVVDQQVVDLTRYGLPTLLRYEDRNSMAHGVESRVPLLDHRLVEFALSVPVEHKIRGVRGKLLMREALRGVLPEVIRNRRSKLGFGGSWHLWVRDLRPRLETWVGQKSLAVDAFVSRPGVAELVRKGDPGVFNVLAFDRWLNRSLGHRP